MPNIVRVNDEEGLRKAGILYKPKTLYQYHSENKYPELFIKIGSMLCVDVDEWEKIVQRAKIRSRKKIRKIG